MEADYDEYEVIRIIHGFRLVDGESYERTYISQDGQPIPAGYYVVHWPEDIRTRRFDEHASFLGPFASRQCAEALVETLNGAYDHRSFSPGPHGPTVAIQLAIA